MMVALTDCRPLRREVQAAVDLAHESMLCSDDRKYIRAKHFVGYQAAGLDHRELDTTVNPLPPRFESYCTGCCSIPTKTQIHCLDHAMQNGDVQPSIVDHHLVPE